MRQKIIKEYPDYSIFDNGKVVSNITGKTKKPVSNRCGKGYLYVDLYKDGKHRKKYIHRLVAEAFIDNPRGLPYVNHAEAIIKRLGEILGGVYAREENQKSFKEE